MLSVSGEKPGVGESVRPELVRIKKKRTEGTLELYTGIPFWSGASGLCLERASFLKEQQEAGQPWASDQRREAYTKRGLGNCHISLEASCACLPAKLLQSSPTLWDPMDCSPPGSSVHGILQARVLDWVVMPSSRGSSWSRDGTCVFLLSLALAGGFFTSKPLGNPEASCKSDLFLVDSRTWYMTALDSVFYEFGFFLASRVNICYFCPPVFFPYVKKTPIFSSRPIPCPLWPRALGGVNPLLTLEVSPWWRHSGESILSPWPQALVWSGRWVQRIQCEPMGNVFPGAKEMEHESGNAGVLLPPREKNMPENEARPGKGRSGKRGAPGVTGESRPVGLKSVCPQTV